MSTVYVTQGRTVRCVKSELPRCRHCTYHCHLSTQINLFKPRIVINAPGELPGPPCRMSDLRQIRIIVGALKSNAKQQPVPLQQSTMSSKRHEEDAAPITRTFEQYCRARKATLNWERSRTRISTTREVVDEILEVVSSDDSLKKKSMDNSYFKHRHSSNWSLSSNSIVTTWPSWFSQDDDEVPAQKSIQSYTSQLFSPLYEVTMDQQNVFQENRRPLPKAGQTPKLVNLSSTLLTQLSDEQNFPDDTTPTADPNVSTKFTSGASAGDSVSTKKCKGLSVSVSALQCTKSQNTRPGVDGSIRDKNRTADHLPTMTKLDLPKLESVTNECAHRIQIPTKSLLSNNYTYVRNDWVLDSLSTADSGELSLEPLLESFAKEQTSFGESIDSIPREEETCSLDLGERDTFEEVQIIAESVKDECTAEQIIISVIEPAPEHFFNDMLQKSLATLFRITVDVMIAPSLFHAADATQLPVTVSARPHFTQSFGSSIPLRYSVLVKGKESDDENGCQILSKSLTQAYTLTYLLSDERNRQLNITSSSSTSSQGNDGCLLLDPQAFCMRLSNWRKVRAPKGTSLTTEGSTRCDKDNLIASCNDVLPDGELECYIMSPLSLSKSADRSTPHTTSNELFDENDRVVLHPGALSLMASEGAGVSVNTGSLLKDNELRAVMKFTNDGEDASTLFPAFSYDSLIASESDDGLDDELGALTTFADDLRQELETAAAVDSTQLPPLTSPIQAPYPLSFSADSSMANFAAVNEVSPSDLQNVRRSMPFVRKVHFNDEVQEYLFVSEVLDTPRPVETDDTFLDEVLGVFEDFLDELSFVCVSVSRAMDRSRGIPDKVKIRRSSAY